MTFPSSNTAFNIFYDQNDISETQFLKNSIVNHTKYGSTNLNSNSSQNFTYITHYVDSNDTLQGLALKYGSKIENIKKFNKLFTDDNNHLRTRLTILIPIESNPVTAKSDLSSAQTLQCSLDMNEISLENNNSNKVQELHSQSFDNGNVLPNNHRKHPFPNKSISLTDNSQLNNENTLSAQESAADFLIRIDSSIAKTKNQLEKISKRIDDGTIENEINKTNSRKFNTPKLSQGDRSLFASSSSSIFPFDNGNNFPSVSVNNNKRKVKSSIKRLEKSQEEIFEL